MDETTSAHPNVAISFDIEVFVSEFIYLFKNK